MPSHRAVPGERDGHHGGDAVTAEHQERSQAARCELTADPIFLFQHATAQLFPDGNWTHCPDCEGFYSAQHEACPIGSGNSETQQVFTPTEVLARDSEAGFIEWTTEAVYYTRAEAEAWGAAHGYRFADGWRVYCVPAKGALARILECADRAFVSEAVATGGAA